MRRFSVQVIIRAIVIVLISIALGVIIGRSDLIVNQIILVVILLALISEFLYYVGRTNRRLQQFISAINNSDFTVNFRDEELGRSYKHLSESFTQVIEKYRSVKIEKEQQFHLLELLVESISVGIMIVRDTGQIVLFNTWISGLLDIPRPNNWSLFKRFSKEIAQAIDDLGTGGSRLVELIEGRESKKLIVDVTTSSDSEGDFRLITIKDIQNEIELKELEAWHNLIRVLTHEMMNSLTPVISLSESMASMVSRQLEQEQLLTRENLEDLIYSLEMIGNRSTSMVDFLEEYRKLTRIPMPAPEKVRVAKLLDDISALVSNDLNKQGIKLSVHPSKTSILVDQGQIELVFLNLLKNSQYALQGSANPEIRISAVQDGKMTYIYLADNGPGIEANIQPNIFVPFFTTKEKGSGIGLSFSRQVMRLHGGKIRLEKSDSSGTIFVLVFPTA